MMLSKILAAVDGSEASKRAFEYASFLAEKCNASLLLVNIADIFERVGSSSKKLEEIAKMLEKFELQAREHGVKDVNTIKQRGDIAEKILKIADKEKVDMIVLGSRGLSTAKVFLLGSVSHKVVQHAKCPVTVVR